MAGRPKATSTQYAAVPAPNLAAEAALSEQEWEAITLELRRRANEPPAALRARQLLTESEIATRLNLAGNDVERQVRRLVRKSHVPFYRVGRSMRLSEEQFEALLEKVRCSPLGREKEAHSGTFAEPSKLATALSTSQSDLRDLVRRQLQKPTVSDSKARSNRPFYLGGPGSRRS
ncbi:MAG: excisionase family DNA-binding protein [Methylocystis sp.]